MPFRSFETATIEVGGNVSSITIVNAAPLMRLGIAHALRVYASLHGRTIVQSSNLADASDTILATRRGDIVILDVVAWSTLETDASGLREHIRSSGVSVCLIACTDDGAHRLLQLRGVSGVVAPDCDAGELELAISELASGKSYFKLENRLAPTTGMAKLSSRQVEILELMTRGLLNKQIAWELGVTEGTVKSHVSAILEKLGCDRRTQAIAAFLQSLGVGSQPMQRALHS